MRRVSERRRSTDGNEKRKKSENSNEGNDFAQMQEVTIAAYIRKQ